MIRTVLGVLVAKEERAARLVAKEERAARQEAKEETGEEAEKVDS